MDRGDPRIEMRSDGPGMPRRMRADALDRDAQAYLRVFNFFTWRRAGSYSVPDLRRHWRLAALAFGQGAPAATVQRRLIEGPGGPIELRIIHPERTAELRPALLWCPGGGFLIGDADCADAMCRAMASASGCAIVVMSYRLAPEHDLYAGRADVLAALRWIAKHGATIGIDPCRLAVGGDSAGGNIAAAVAQRCRNDGGPALRLQLLCYPATNLLNDYPSKAENARGYLLTADAMRWIRSQFPGPVDFADPWLSPRFEPRLEGLPPALIVTAGFDPVRDDGLDYAARLRNAGVAVELLHYPGQFHGFLNFDALIGAARDALQRIGRSVGRTLRSGVAADSTIEIADAPKAQSSPAREMAADLTKETMTVWASFARWNDALLQAVSPRASVAARLLALPWAAPARSMRSYLSARLDRLSAQQTHCVPGN